MKFPQLTFTRFIAAIFIVVFHFFANKPCLDKIYLLKKIVLIAPTFVSYFFLLSGFILVISSIDSSKSQYLSYPKFWISRLARIYPMFLIAYLLTLFLYHQSTGTFPPVSVLVTNLLLLQAWVPLTSFSVNFPDWSLSCEVFFYLLFPFVFQRFLILKQRTVIIILFCLYISNLFIHIKFLNVGFTRNIVFNDHWFHNVVFHFPLMHLSTFMIGVGFGVVFKENYEVWKRYSVYWGWFAALSAFTWMWLVCTNNSWIIYHHNGLFTPLYIIMLMGLLLSRNWLVQLFSLKPFVWLGEISYNIYILQLPIYWLVNLPSLPKYGTFSISAAYIYFPLLFAISAICHTYIEIPLKYKILTFYNRSKFKTLMVVSSLHQSE